MAEIAISATMMMYSVMPWPSWRVRDLKDMRATPRGFCVGTRGGAPVWVLAEKFPSVRRFPMLSRGRGWCPACFDRFLRQFGMRYISAIVPLPLERSSRVIGEAEGQPPIQIREMYVPANVRYQRAGSLAEWADATAVSRGG